MASKAPPVPPDQRSKTNPGASAAAARDPETSRDPAGGNAHVNLKEQGRYGNDGQRVEDQRTERNADNRRKHSHDAHSCDQHTSKDPDGRNSSQDHADVGRPTHDVLALLLRQVEEPVYEQVDPPEHDTHCRRESIR